jgi:hypothetical protein
MEKILSGEETAKYYLNFLNKNNKTDMTILKDIKVCHRDSPKDRTDI